MSTTAEKLLLHARVTGELLKRAQDWQHQLEEKQELQKQAADLVPAVVKALVENDRIYEEQAEKVAEALSAENGHVAALELLQRLAAHQPSGAGMSPTGQHKTANTRRFRPIDAPDPDFYETEAGRRYRERLLGSAY